MSLEDNDFGESPLSGVLGLLFSVGARRRPSGWLQAIITAYGALLAAWVIYSVTVAIIDPLALGAIFLSFMLVLLFLIVGARPGSLPTRPSWLDWLFAASSFACGVYFAVSADAIVVRISLLDPLGPWDILFGTLIWVLSLEATRRAVGLGLTLIVAVIVTYNLFGHMLGGVLAHGEISYLHFLDQTVFTTNGIFGAPIQVAATYAFLFVTFGTLLHKAGGGEFFFNLAAALKGTSPGGPAKVAVVSSALYGTISGSPTSDVVTTGSITIPMMRRLGYPRALAGGVEVAASASGGLLPPVMGSAAFIMVEITGISYRDVVFAAIIPAFLYCLGVYAQVHLTSLRLGLRGMNPDAIPTLREAMREGGLFVVPLITLMVALFMGYTVTYVAVFAIASVLVVAAVKKSTRIGPRALYHALAMATMRMVPVTAACAAAGLVVGGISMTGLSGKFAFLVGLVAGGSLLPALLACGALAILLGMGMPTPSAYIMAAVLAAPLLTDLGIETLVVHMFLLYFAVLSAITPPVAVAAYAASSIAQANPLIIASHAVRIASSAFVVPFMFVFGPELLGEGSVWQVTTGVITASVGVLALAAASEGYLDAPLPWWRRVMLAVGGIALMLPGFASDIVGGLVLSVCLGRTLFRYTARWRLFGPNCNR